MFPDLARADRRELEKEFAEGRGRDDDDSDEEFDFEEFDDDEAEAEEGDVRDATTDYLEQLAQAEVRVEGWLRAREVRS